MQKGVLYRGSHRYDCCCDKKSEPSSQCCHLLTNTEVLLFLFPWTLQWASQIPRIPAIVHYVSSWIPVFSITQIYRASKAQIRGYLHHEMSIGIDQRFSIWEADEGVVSRSPLFLSAKARQMGQEATMLLCWRKRESKILENHFPVL